MLSPEDDQKALELYESLTNDINTVKYSIDKITKDINEGKYDFSKGISLLDLKNTVFLSYFTNLSYVTLLKLSGESIAGKPVIDRLIEQRAVFERLTPYESKLRDQIRKSVEEADANAEQQEKPLLSRFEADDDQGSSKSKKRSKKTSIEEEEDEEASTGALYQAPTVSAKAFPSEERAAARLAAARQRVLRGAMVQDVLEPYSSAPSVLQGGGVLQRRARRMMEERQRHEEDTFTRLPWSKKERQMVKTAESTRAFGEQLLGFTGVAELTGAGAAKRRRKDKGKPKKKGSKKRKR